jgi:Arc/MetJ-type ribon-helix-helix transcriptional regulator
VTSPVGRDNRSIVLYGIVTKNNPDRKAYTFNIDNDLADGLDEVKERDGISVSEQIRRAIRAWLESKDIKMKRQGAGARKRGRRIR